MYGESLAELHPSPTYHYLKERNRATVYPDHSTMNAHCEAAKGLYRPKMRDQIMY